MCKCTCEGRFWELGNGQKLDRLTGQIVELTEDGRDKVATEIRRFDQTPMREN